MTINITKEIEASYKAFLAEQVDAYVDGAPILRSQTYPFSLGHSSVVEFAAGWQAALLAGQATEPVGFIKEATEALLVEILDDGATWCRNDGTTEHELARSRSMETHGRDVEGQRVRASARSTRQ